MKWQYSQQTKNTPGFIQIELSVLTLNVAEEPTYSSIRYDVDHEQCNQWLEQKH